jgi:hypothetical protein
MVSESNIIKGERLQQVAEMYLGRPEDFQYNPKISVETHKHCDIESVSEPISNPSILFCYGHCIRTFIQKLEYFKNPFVLITHNSDENILPTPEILRLATHPLLKKWYAQNVCVEHRKIVLLPIGLANDQWAHGNTSFFANRTEYSKTENVYFYFNLHTNYIQRNECYKLLRDTVPFLEPVSVEEYHKTLSQYKFCICPEGNGADTHRLWEAYYLKSIPIVVLTPFIYNLKKQMPELPLIVLNSWSELRIDNLHYDQFKMNNHTYLLDLSYWIMRIRMDAENY